MQSIGTVLEHLLERPKTPYFIDFFYFMFQCSNKIKYFIFSQKIFYRKLYRKLEHLELRPYCLMKNAKYLCLVSGDC